MAIRRFSDPDTGLGNGEETMFPRYGVGADPTVMQALRQGGEAKAFAVATGSGARNRSVFDQRLPRLALVHSLGPGEAEPASQVDSAHKPELTWIQVRLLNEGGDPMSGAAYRIALPGGGERKGKLDVRGEAREEGIERGSCSVSFPDLAERPLPTAPA